MPSAGPAVAQEQLDATFTALADPTRRAIVARLARGDATVNELAAPFDLTLPSGRCYSFVCPKKRRESANVRAFRAWLREEAAALDWSKCATRAADSRPAAGSSATH